MASGGRSRYRAIAFALPFLLVFLAASELAAAPPVATYEGLLRAIRETRAASEARIEAAVEQEKVREAWEIGKLIQEHILLKKARAEYGKRVLRRLSKDLRISVTEIQYMLEFSRSYPIYPTSGKLSWGHYRDLLAVNDLEERSRLESLAESQDLPVAKLRKEINRRKLAASKDFPAELPKITPGPLHTYQIIRLKDRLKIDLGFGLYLDLPGKERGRFKEGDIVQIVGARSPRPSTKGGETPPLQILKNASPSDLFTYPALATQVVDGDSAPRNTAQEMRAGPSKPTCGSGLQSALSGMGQKPVS